MVEISPKALRFARMAAEQNGSFARDARLTDLRRIERDNANLVARAGYRAIPDDLAAFCLEAVVSLLDDSPRLSSNGWDGNDVLFMRSLVQSLREQLAAPVVSAR